MYKVMLVDDDVPMIKYLTKLIAWEALDTQIAATAYSGKRALQCFREADPDLVITDIGMPHMDGLELAAELQKMKPDVRIIFLTCHEEFHFARKAVQLAADDYLIKDELDAGQLEESIRKALAELGEKRRHLGELGYRQDMLKNREVWKRQFLKQLVTNASIEEMAEGAKRLGIEWKESHYVMAVGSLNYATFPKQYRYADAPLLLYGIANIAEELSCDGLSVTTLTDSESRFVCIANYQPNLNRNTAVVFESYLTLLRQKIVEYMKTDVSIFWGDTFKGLEGIRKQYNKLLKGSRVQFYSDLAFGRLPESDAPLWSLDVAGTIGEEWNRIIQAFKERNEPVVYEALEAIRAKTGANRLDPSELLSKCSQWIRVLELEGGQASDEAFHSCLKRCVRLEEARGIVEGKITELLTSVQLGKPVKTPKLQQIDRFISERLSENISLMDIADYLFLNPSYFSRYFKQETGMNFTDYLHSYKMKVACKLLKDKQESIEMIALKLGYMERTYFSKVFKKYVGVSPKDYR